MNRQAGRHVTFPRAASDNVRWQFSHRSAVTAEKGGSRRDTKITPPSRESCVKRASVMVDIAAKARVRETLLMWSPQWDSTHVVRSPHVAYDEGKEWEGRKGGWERCASYTTAREELTPSEYFDAIRKGLLGRGHSFDVANHICHEIEHARWEERATLPFSHSHSILRFSPRIRRMARKRERERNRNCVCVNVTLATGITAG